MFVWNWPIWKKFFEDAYIGIVEFQFNRTVRLGIRIEFIWTWNWVFMSRNPVFYKIGKGLFKAEWNQNIRFRCWMFWTSYDGDRMLFRVWVRVPFSDVYTSLYVWVPWEGFNVLIFNILHPVLWTKIASVFANEMN